MKKIYIYSKTHQETTDQRIGQFIVGYLVAKPLIWSEAEVDMF